MSVEVKFNGGIVDARTITAADWKSLGIENQGKVTWDKSNRFTAEVTEEAAEWLLQDDPDRMSVAGEPAAAAGDDEDPDAPEGGEDSGSAGPVKATGPTKKAARRA